VTDIQPNTAPNDLDTLVVISGTDLTTGMSGTQVITLPMVYLDGTALADVIWVETTTLSATVPWGLEAGVYTLTVENPNGETGSIPNAFTVTQGFGVWNGGELYGGNIDQIVINPLTPTTLYAIANDVGLFRSQDGGESWTFKAVGPSGVAIDPVSPNRVYGGWLRSDDEGETWMPLTVTFPITQTSGVDCGRAYQIYTHPGTVYATACYRGGESGLIASTNHGETWTPMMGGLTDTQVTALAFHPTDPQTIYLGTASGNIFISHNGGVTWTFASQPLGNVGQIAVSPFEPHEVWIATGWPGLSYPCGGLKSANAELTAWTPITGLGYDFCGDSPILFTPKAWGGVYSKTVFIYTYKTSDGGATWQPFGPGNYAEIKAVHPSDPDLIYSGSSSNNSGIHRTTDGGVTWELASQGLTGIFPWSLEVVPDRPDVVFAGTNIGAVFKGTGGGSAWKRLPIGYGGGRGGSIVVDPVTPTRVYAGAGYPTSVYISNDGGDTWPIFVTIEPPEVYSQCSHWVDTLLPVPGEPGVILAGVLHYGGPFTLRGSIYRSTDYGENWDRVYPTPTQEISQVNDLAYDPISPTVVYAAAGRGGWGGLYKSTNSGLTLESIGEGQLNGELLDIQVEPGTHRVFVTINAGLPLYVSDDGGATWTPTVSAGGGGNVNEILFVPSVTPGNPPVLYNAAMQGLYRSTDGAQSWQPVEGALGQVPVFSLAAVAAEDRIILYAGTTGGVISLANTAGALNQNNTILINAGVYRYTMLNYRLFLPVIAR
jgi:photosystem II stability/assembly factor-like uncharacterized protein